MFAGMMLSFFLWSLARFNCALNSQGSQLGGTYILSLLFYTVNVYCDYTSIYYYIRSHSSCQFIVGVFARPLHSTSEFAKAVLSKCVCVCARA